MVRSSFRGGRGDASQVSASRLAWRETKCALSRLEGGLPSPQFATAATLLLLLLFLAPLFVLLVSPPPFPLSHPPSPPAVSCDLEGPLSRCPKRSESRDPPCIAGEVPCTISCCMRFRCCAIGISLIGGPDVGLTKTAGPDVGLCHCQRQRALTLACAKGRHLMCTRTCKCI